MNEQLQANLRVSKLKCLLCGDSPEYIFTSPDKEELYTYFCNICAPFVPDSEDQYVYEDS